VSGTWVLDSEALSKYLLADRAMTAKLAVARQDDARVIISAATIVEADHDKVHPARLTWALSTLTTEPLTKALAQSASALLKNAGLHGHKYGIDAMVAATALAAINRPVLILTSDVEDLTVLLGDRADTSKNERDTDPAKIKVLRV
jgi:hypothetical protein